MGLADCICVFGRIGKGVTVREEKKANECVGPCWQRIQPLYFMVI